MRSTTAAPRPAMIAVRRWAGVSPEAATPTATALSPARVRSISSTWSRTTRSWIRGAWSAAVVLRIGFALLATRLLGVIGLTLAGGLILLWVCWKMWRDLRAAHLAAADAEGGHAAAKSFGGALLQIMLADLSMSLDNVLAVAGAAREHPALLVFGLILSIALMGLAAEWIARMLNRARWMGYLGLVVVVYVALHMVWDGHRVLVIDMHETARYNAIAPQALQITPAEIAAHKAEHRKP